MADVPEAPGRLPGASPVAVIDIGSNSVRLVVYETLGRAPTQLFNEKAMCALGRSIASTGELHEASIAKALDALRRFRALVRTMGVDTVHVIATAAVRDAKNGAQFLRAAEAVADMPIRLLSGREEAEMSAYGVVSGCFQPDGIVGDMGGGSLELVEVAGDHVRGGVTLPLGGLTLQDVTQKSVAKAEKIVADALKGQPLMDAGRGRVFYAVGGTWRALANLHMAETGYPLHVMHGYEMSVESVLALCGKLKRGETDDIRAFSTVSSSRRALLGYGAVVLEGLVTRLAPRSVVVSALGVREGLLYTLLDEAMRRDDPLVAAARELGYLRARSPRHGHELIEWTGAFIASMGHNEPWAERRLREAACHLADIGWRAHPDYRGAQSLNIIANAGFIAIDHPGRVFLALTSYFRHSGLKDDELSTDLRKLASPELVERARLIAGAFRIAYLVSAATPGTLPQTRLTVTRDTLELALPRHLEDLHGDRLFNRVRQLAKVLNVEPALTIE